MCGGLTKLLIVCIVIICAYTSQDISDRPDMADCLNVAFVAVPASRAIGPGSNSRQGCQGKIPTLTIIFWHTGREKKFYME